MKISLLFRTFFFQCLCLLLLPFSTAAQNPCNATTLDDFFNCYGGKSAFSAHSIAAVTTFVKADSALMAKNFVKAKSLIDNLFNTYPKGNNIWWNVFNAPNGANIGTPHAYYGLRMMEDIIDHGLNGDPNVLAKKVNMKIVLVGCSKGIQPTTEAELLNGKGTFVTHSIDSSLKKNNYRIVKQSYDLFLRYVNAITKGKLKIEVEFIELDTLCLPVGVTTSKPHLAYSGIDPVWGALTQAAKDSTDWWWVMYPSHVPEYATFDDEAFITGGMGADYKGGPVFIIDDKWVVRKPAHLGKGNYSDIERRIYLPQWLQHEFFHHLYRIYPELALEVKGHDWFDPKFWPSDFKGQFETDYYSETLHKRLQVNCVPLATKLITRVESNSKTLFNTFSMNELFGAYSQDVVQNSWHEANIINENGTYFWKNKANVKWKVTPNFATGKLETGNDCPYPGSDFFIELFRTVEGDFIPGAVGLKFSGELYKKRFNLLRKTVPVEIALGIFERVPKLTHEHTGNIVKTAGQLYWQNDSGSNWSLTPNTLDEYFDLNTDSPTPDEKLPLVLVQTDCALHTLGFKYLDHYFWKPKRNTSNTSPKIVTGIADLELPKNFGTYNIDLTNVFKDSEGDSLLLFVTSEDSTLISSNIKAKQLTLKGGKVGKTTIFVMALDANGGLAVDEFNVQVKQVLSTNEAQSNISVFPSLTQDYIHIVGVSPEHNISLISINSMFQQHIPVTGESINVDISHLYSGTYLVVIKNSKSEIVKVDKIIKY
jgi:hypothetical protein